MFIGIKESCFGLGFRISGCWLSCSSGCPKAKHGMPWATLFLRLGQAFVFLRLPEAFSRMSVMQRVSSCRFHQRIGS